MDIPPIQVQDERSPVYADSHHGKSWTEKRVSSNRDDGCLFFYPFLYDRHFIWECIAQRWLADGFFVAEWVRLYPGYMRENPLSIGV
jgi:hypothetical protein